jgi:hypothetical protein
MAPIPAVDTRQQLPASNPTSGADPCVIRRWTGGIFSHVFDLGLCAANMDTAIGGRLRLCRFILFFNDLGDSFLRTKFRGPDRRYSAPADACRTVTRVGERI